MLRVRQSNGSSVIEVIIAMAVFAIIAGGLMSMAVGSFTGLMQGGEQTQAAAIADEGLEAVKAIYGRAWNELTYSTSSVSVAGGTWQFDGEDTTETIGKFTRTIAFLEVCRGVDNMLAECPADHTDVDMKEIVVTVAWNPRPTVTNTVVRRAYITNWESREWGQTNWRGGDGQDVWSNEHMFASSTGIDVGTTGELKLENGAAGSWANAGGVVLIHTTLEDFSGGTLDRVAVSGEGDLGAVSLAYASGTEYAATGTLTSSVIDTESEGADWRTISWTQTLTAGSAIAVVTRSGETPLPNETWSAWSDALADPSGSTISSPDGRYFQYQVSFTVGNLVTETPTFDDVTLLYNAPTLDNLNAVAGVSSNDVWAVTNTGTTLHYNGSTWLSEALDGAIGSLNDIVMESESLGWIVGDGGKVFTYDGVAWTESADTGDETWNAIAMVGTSTGFVVGNASGVDGTVAVFDGATWNVSTIAGLGADLHDVFAISATEVWAVGAAGKIVHYDGVSWSEADDLGDITLYGLTMRSLADGWAVGDAGMILAYDGIAWTEFVDTGDQVWHAVGQSSSNRGWIVGENGAMAQWDGSTWTETAVISVQHLHGLGVISRRNAWAVGDTGAILKFSQDAAYVTTGALMSSAYDLGSAVPVQTVSWESTIPTCDPECSVALQLAVAPDAAGVPGEWSEWYGADGVGTYFTSGTGSLVPTDLNGYRWVRYQATLIGDGNETPVVTEVRVNHK